VPNEEGDDDDDEKTTRPRDGDEHPLDERDDPPHGLEEMLRLNLGGGLHRETGTIIDGKWELRRLLGEGGFGKVYEAWHLQLDRGFAIKLLDARHGGPELKQRFLEEARLMAGLASEHLVRASDYGELSDGRPYFVMELVQGRTLRHYLRERMPVSRAMEIAEELLEGLAEVHKRGVVHGDIKPENVIIGDEDDKARLLDFGLAQTSVAAGGGVGGTPPYMAPEMLLDGVPASPRTDVYAIGVVLYEMLTSRMPRGHADMDFQKLRRAWGSKPKADPVRMHRQEVSEALDAFVMEALSREPTARFKSAQQMLEELRRAQSRVSSEGLAVTLVPEPGAPASMSELRSTHKIPIDTQRRRQWWLVPVAIGAAVVVGVGGWWVLGGGPEPSQESQSHVVIDEAEIPKVESPRAEELLAAPDLELARDGILVVTPHAAGQGAVHAHETFCEALGGRRRVEGALPVFCKRIPATNADTLVSLANEAQVKVVVLVEDETITVRSTSHHGGIPVLARLDGLPLLADASLTEQVAPVLRAVVDAAGSSDVEIPALDRKQVGPRWAVLAELLRFQRGHDAHEDRVRRKDLREALDRMLVQARDRSEGDATGFYRDVAALLEASSPGVDSEALATLRELSEAGGHQKAIRIQALLGLAELLSAGGASQAEAAEAALTEAFASSADQCVRLAAVGTLSWIDRWNEDDALWEANGGRLPSIRSCDPTMWNKVLRVRGDALVARQRWCDAASSYERAYGVLPTTLEPLLAWAEYGWLCASDRGASRQALLDQLRAALDSKYFEQSEQRVSIAYMRWWLIQDPADAQAVVDRYAEVTEGDVALIEGVASDLEAQICRGRDDASCSRRILARPKRPGDEALLRASLGLR
jgi:hypothetical protein